MEAQAMPTTVTENLAKRQALFTQLYLDVFPMVAAFVSKRNGTLEDAQDVFQDALVVFYEKSNEAGFAAHTSREAYIMGIARHLWFRKFNAGIKLEGLDGIKDDAAPPGEADINAGRVLQLLERTGEKCLNLLHAFYYGQLPLRQISKLLGYGSERSATVQKYKCLEKIRDTIKENSVGYAHFID
jgi:DNA-directed RNA polymerase specialized sigma24 family protein